MNIKEQKVQPIMCTAYCDECGSLMVKSNVVLVTYPEKYKYKCNKCGKEETSFTEHPYIDYRVIDEKGK